MPRKIDARLVMQAIRLARQGLTHEEISEQLRRGDRTIDNYVSLKWLEEHKLLHLLYTEDPVSSIQKEAARQCDLGDHRWIWDKRFEFHAYSQVEQETVTENLNGTMVLEGSRIAEIVSRSYRTHLDRVCKFCGQRFPDKDYFATVVTSR